MKRDLFLTKPHVSNRMEGMIVLYRKNLSIGWFRKYKLFIDNEVKDTIKPGEKLEINLDDGEHEIFIKVDWLESKKIKFIQEGSIHYFECGSKYNFWTSDMKFWIKEINKVDGERRFRKNKILTKKPLAQGL